MQTNTMVNLITFETLQNAIGRKHLKIKMSLVFKEIISALDFAYCHNSQDMSETSSEQILRASQSLKMFGAEKLSVELNEIVKDLQKGVNLCQEERVYQVFFILLLTQRELSRLNENLISKAFRKLSFKREDLSAQAYSLQD